MAVAAQESGLTSVVVVAADSGPLLIQAVGAALASSAPVEVIVVDNASADGCPERVRATHPDDARLRMLGNGRNIGFGPACNRGADIARGDALLFLNPDCLVERDTIAELRAVAAARADDIGLLGAEVVTPDGRPARGNRRRDPTLRRMLASASGLARFEPRWPALAGVEMPPAASLPRIEPVDAVSGACLFLPRRAFDAVGGFDEGYFLHAEDLDLCRRVRDAGFVVAIVNGLRVRHAQGSSSRRRPLFVAWHKHRSLWRYFRKFDPAAGNALVRAGVWLGLWLRFASSVPLYAWRQALSRREEG